MSDKIIIRIKGGLGNQLFCYAAARGLSLRSNAELVIDDVSGFIRDYQYHRKYVLDRFAVKGRKASPAERLEPFERMQRALKKQSSRLLPIGWASYIEERKPGFNKDLFMLKVKGTKYLDGYWQSEKYFQDVENIIRDDLSIIPPQDWNNVNLARQIDECESVALHIRWYDTPQSGQNSQNLTLDYYKKAIAYMQSRLDNPHYFIFSDYPENTCFELPISKKNITRVLQGQNDNSACFDFWLMSKCKHFIIANSSFSWWGAWLSNNNSKIIIAPKKRSETEWTFDTELPANYIAL